MSAAGSGDRFDVFDDGMIIAAGNLSKREAWGMAATVPDSTVLPHECTPDCGHVVPRGRSWLEMTDRREFDTALPETQGALFPEPSRTGDVPLFGNQYGEDLWS